MSATVEGATVAGAASAVEAVTAALYCGLGTDDVPMTTTGAGIADSEAAALAGPAAEVDEAFDDLLLEVLLALRTLVRQPEPWQLVEVGGEASATIRFGAPG